MLLAGARWLSPEAMPLPSSARKEIRLNQRHNMREIPVANHESAASALQRQHPAAMPLPVNPSTPPFPQHV